MNLFSDQMSFTGKPSNSRQPCSDWNLVLLATMPRFPRRVLDLLDRAVRETGGWVLRQGEVSEQCVDIDFEFPRLLCVEIYSALLATGMELCSDAHAQLADLSHCTQHVSGDARCEVARIHLSIYAGEGAEAFVGQSPRRTMQAA